MSRRSNKFNVVSTADSSYFGLGRVVYFDDRLNRRAILGSLVSAVLLMIWVTFSGRMSTTEATTFGIVGACNFFFTYLIAQELDPEPKRRAAGLLGGLLAVVAQVFMGAGDVTMLLWALFVIRMFNRTSGSRHKLGDNILILVAAFWLGKHDLWLMPGLTAACYVLESQIKEGYFRSLYMAGIACAMYLFVERPAVTPGLTLTYVILLCICVFLFAPELSVASQCTARGDRDNRPLITQRILMGQGVFLLGSFFLIFFCGDAAIKSLYPVWMAAAACGIYLLIFLIHDKKVAEAQAKDAR
jgi:hypothetical protein